MPSERIVASRRVDEDEIGLLRFAGNQRFHAFGVETFDDMTLHRREIDPSPLHRFRAILEIAAHGALTMIEIEGGNTCSAIGQRHRDMHGSRGFAGTTLFIGENDTVRLGSHREAIGRVIGLRPYPTDCAAATRAQLAVRDSPQWRMLTSVAAANR